MRTLLLSILCLSAAAQNQPTVHFSTARLSANTSEINLTTANATTARFGLLKTLSLDGRVRTQPLYVTGLSIGGHTRNVMYIATANNTIYAYDADTLAALWNTGSLVAPCVSSCSTGASGIWGLNYNQPVGIFGTPAIDTANGWIFCVTYDNTPVWKLWKLNLLTGATISSASITASVTGSTASDAVAGTLTFNHVMTTQRAGLVIANSNVYINFSSPRDATPWHGWILAYAESNLAQVAALCLNKNQNGGGIWQPASVDASGNLYVVTGNGGTASGSWTSSYDGSTEWSMTVLKLSSTLSILDWYTPANYAAQNAVDTDLGSSPPMLIPDPASPGNYRIVLGGKDYNVYNIPSSCMGHLGGTVNGCPGAQVFATGSDAGAHLGIYGDAFMSNIAYFPNTAGALYSFAFNNTGLFNTTPTTGSTVAFPGAMMTLSSNNGSNPVVWALTADASTLSAPANGHLRSINAATLAELGNWDIGNIAKFISPTVAGGKVFVPTYDSTVRVYGIIANNFPMPTPIIR